MKAVFAGLAVGVVVGQRVAHRGKGERFPRHVGFVEQLHFQRFRAGTEIQIKQAGAEQDVDLVDVRNVVHRIQRADFDTGIGLFQRFACRALCRGFAVFHETGGDGPQAVARFNRATAQQDAMFPFSDAADDHFRVLIMDRAAGIADMPGQAVARRDFKRDGGAAVAAELHG